MIRRPPRSTQGRHSFPTRRSSDLVPVTRGTRLGADSLSQWPQIHAALTQVRRLPSASSSFHVIPSAQRVSLHPWRLKSNSTSSVTSLWLSESFPMPRGTRCSPLIARCSANSTSQLSGSPPLVLPVPSPLPRADSGQISFCPLTSPALASPSGIPADPFSGLLFHPHHPPAPWKVFSLAHPAGLHLERQEGLPLWSWALGGNAVWKALWPGRWQLARA